MFTEINRQLEEAQQGISRLRKINAMLVELRHEQQALEEKTAELKLVLAKENLDVSKLEGKSLAHVFYSVLGSLPEKVEKEEREALAARLKYDQAERDLEDVKQRTARLIAQRANLIDWERKYEDLFEQKKAELEKSGTQAASVLLDSTAQLNISRSNLQEIQEAAAAGANVLSSLEEAMSRLNSAEGWGVWDMLGGGLLTDIIKHSHIDDARSEVERAHALLQHFKSELADITINYDVHIETGGFTKFADFFFDGLIADWFMQSEIHNSQASIEGVMDQVQNVLTKLGDLQAQESRRIEQLTREIDAVITNA